MIDGAQLCIFILVLSAFWILMGPLVEVTGLEVWKAGLLVNLCAIGLSFLGRKLARFLLKEKSSDQAVSPENQFALDEFQAGILVSFTKDLVDLQNEKDFMNASLKFITEFSGATAVSFVSLDEWGQTLPVYTCGSLPDEMLKTWAEHIISERTKKLCSVCTDLVAKPGQTCPLLQGYFLNNHGVYCVPVQKDRRLLGMLNLYYAAGQEFPVNIRPILDSILKIIIIAIDAIRIREQEHATIAQLKIGRWGKSELSAQLLILLKNIRQTVNADYIRLQIRDTEFGQNGIRIEDGQINTGLAPFFEDATLDVLVSGKEFILNKKETAAKFPSSLSIHPLNSSQGDILGVMLMTGGKSGDIDVESHKAMKNIIDQIISALEMDQYLLSLEYRLVIQERSRLAREIHDHLAQTLAFLKLQSAQMVNLVKQKDLNRLNSMLDLHYLTLSEAYLDTREAIDNLRLKPEQDFFKSLDLIAAGFEEMTKIPVIRKYDFSGLGIHLEIQAQVMRIIQEALNNIRKHAKARHVTIAVKKWQDNLIIEVQDDGIGFQPPDIPEADQHGLRGMRERAEWLGADFQVASIPGHGTIVRLHLPLLEERNG